MGFSIAALSQAATPSGFRQIGQTLNDSTKKSRFGIGVELSDDGTHLVVASKDGISIFRRDDTTAVEDIADATWQPSSLEIPFDSKQGSFSSYGTLLAVRLQDKLEIYDIKTGNKDSIDVCPDGKNVKLGKTHPASTFGDTYWLLVSCEYYNSNTGRVDILRRDNRANQWIPLTSIMGENPGALFGYATGFNVHDLRSPLIAVSSPFYERRQGLVQVYSLSQTGFITQKGSKIVGQTAGDKFGFSIAMSTTGLPHLVVGAPECLGRRGCVSVYDWSRVGFFSPFDWNPIGHVIAGEEDEESFGRSVAISRSATRIAASSVRKNVVRLYENDSSNFSPVGVFEGEERSQWGFDVSLNDSGSMVVSGALAQRNVQVFLDETPFCSHPIDGYSNTQLFLERSVCKTQLGELVASESACSKIHSYPHGRMCEWTTHLSTRAPSDMPSVSLMPSASPSTAPSAIPSAAPSSSPSAAPSSRPTAAPSSSSSAAPSSSRNVSPSSSPSVSPSGAPSVAGSQPPSSSPSQSSSPSLRQIASPSNFPTPRPSTPPSAAPTSLAAAKSVAPNLITATSAIGLTFLGVVAAWRRRHKRKKTEETEEEGDEESQ